MTTADVIQRIENECELPESWNAIETQPDGSIEMSGYDGENMQEAILELLNGDIIAEVAMHHSNMPGRASAHKLDELDEPELPVPSQMGVLQFQDLDDAIEAVRHLADPDVLADIAQHRSAIERDDPLSVSEAVAEVTDIDMSTVDDTLTAI